ncbi:type VI secretion system ImpA family N-terminal domain-containing protein, partial [Clostridium perfringens]|nr:type VI secretion system ImpA family N-terminal domain-containing protein [Clostridium perfringens]
MSGELDPFFVAISDELPSGVDLEYDPEFARMEKAARGVPEQAVGSSVIEAQPPDWDEVRDAALQLLARSKDLRI